MKSSSNLNENKMTAGEPYLRHRRPDRRLKRYSGLKSTSNNFANSTDSYHFFKSAPYSIGNISSPRECDQKTIINNINAYLIGYNNDIAGKKTGVPIREELNSKGVCHGMSLLWLQLSLLNREEKFYQFLKNIAAYEICHDANGVIKPNIDIDIFYAFVDRSQNPHKYFVNSNWANIESISHLSLNVPEKKIHESKADGLEDELKKLIDEGEASGVAISSFLNNIPLHTIGLCYKKDKYMLYDPNFKTGRAMEFTSLKDAIPHIISTAYGGQAPEYLIFLFNKVTVNLKSEVNFFASFIESGWKLLENISQKLSFR